MKEPFVKVRMRLRCELQRVGEPSQVFRVLNEVVIDRGTSGFLSTLECYCDDSLITHVQADG
jgi:NAD+ kinase